MARRRPPFEPAVELRSFDCFQNLENSPHRPWWWVPVLWLDPLRGFFGTILVQRGAAGITEVTWSLIPKPEYALFVAVKFPRKRSVPAA